jgi:hypothetical protein
MQIFLFLIHNASFHRLFGGGNVRCAFFLPQCHPISKLDLQRPLLKTLNSDAFFVQSNRNSLKNQPIGKNYFAAALKSRYAELNFPPSLVPHSIRATTATQLYNQGVSEQLITETTGHRSVAVRGYKHTSAKQTLNVQALLAPGNKRKADEILENERSYLNHGSHSVMCKTTQFITQTLKDQVLPESQVC